MRTWLALLLGAVLGVVAGAGGMLGAFPYLFPPPVLDEPAPDAAALAAGGTTSRLGTFEFDRDAPGRDPIHWANGTGGIYRSGEQPVLRFEADFETGPGPKFVVYLNTVPVGEEAEFTADAGRRMVAPLKSFRGAQNYHLPVDLDLARYHTVTILCDAFGVYIGSAVLPTASG